MPFRIQSIYYIHALKIIFDFISYNDIIPKATFTHNRFFRFSRKILEDRV